MTPPVALARAVKGHAHENTSPFASFRRDAHSEGMPNRRPRLRNHLARMQKNMQKFRAKAAQIGDNLDLFG
jgi:hypothetical protein